MSKELPFLVYCIEEYKVQHKMGGKDVVDLFNRYKVNEYIITCYDALHTTGARYIVEDIDEYINARKKTAQFQRGLNNGKDYQKCNTV